MKRMIALLLGLLLVFPAVSLSEDEARTVEFEDFTLVVGANDLLLTGDEAGSANIFKVFPNDDENAATHPNIIAWWTERVIGDLSDAEVAGKGTYYFTVGCSTQEEAEALFSYLDTHLIIKK